MKKLLVLFLIGLLLTGCKVKELFAPTEPPEEEPWGLVICQVDTTATPWDTLGCWR